MRVVLAIFAVAVLLASAVTLPVVAAGAVAVVIVGIGAAFYMRRLYMRRRKTGVEPSTEPSAEPSTELGPMETE